MVKDGGKHGAHVDPSLTRQSSGVLVNRQDHRVFNKRLLTVEKSILVVFDESDNYMPKPVSENLECDDLKSVLHKK